MILPNKYVTLSQSYLGISAMILTIIGSSKTTIEKLWEDFEKKYVVNNNGANNPSYQKFLLTLDFMYFTNMLNYNKEGEIYNENIGT
ncbi:TPA: ABC-three component system middle component 6 [Streptococcus agalactiae]|jgi:hypothetical protein|uniref:ABC-three component system middle component 6 n=1 Tax=Peptoniphilaceae TaxID=1570339 RepID=UPI0002898A71|nr:MULTISPECIES: ABC-three component system middle component 6 [Peptoniphilaceae]MBS5966589.1 hypothetical protein [Finegoldia magna]MDU2829952.1 ABC-three component system middle component 6 [Anaerococcus sp.]